MTEWMRYQDLYERFIECYVGFDTAPNRLTSQENRRTENEAAWESKREALVERITHALENDGPWPVGRVGIPDLMWLAALDEVLSRTGLEDMVQREQPKLHVVHGREWRAFLREVPLSPARPHAVQGGHLRNWLRHHMIVPLVYPPYPVLDPKVDPESGLMTDPDQERLRIEIAPSTHLARALKKQAGGELKVWLGTFPDGVMPDWPNISQGRCTSARLDDPDTRRCSILQSLEQAQEAGAHVVILPELAVCPTLRDEILAWLDMHEPGFLLVVPGSYHEADPNHPERLPCNRAWLCDGSGGVIVAHEKFIPFKKDHPCHELITPGNRVTLWRTALGVISLAICRDFCEEEGWVRQLWDMLAPEWLLVPSMSNDGGIGAHVLQAKHLYNTCGTRTLLPNQTPGKNFTSDTSHGFIYPSASGATTQEWISPDDRLKKLILP
ncbi:MAG: carbon-nitrogen hydrolase family protein [Magnetococcales bacterium]|nr:carbon-nitrogen hydrolase family protein [Magnetococcales bacterium]